jgi:hypothetical protein
MNRSSLSNSQPARLPIVVRAGDFQALADRLEERARAAGDQPDRDLMTAARLCRHAATVWVGRSAVSLWPAIQSPRRPVDRRSVSNPAR